jgi:hypothetical protein
MKVSDMFPRKYLGGEDLQGKAYRVVIERVRQEELRVGPGAKPEPKWVMYLSGTRKGIILSRTLAEQVAAAVGSDETDDWTGKTVVIYPEPMTVAGKRRVAIRARAPKAEPGAEAAEMKHEEEEEE